MVGVAVGVAAASVAATAASGAMKAKGGKGGGGPSLPETPRWEQVFDRGTSDLLNEQKGLLEDALAQQGALQPELYKLLGYEPIYDQAGPDLGALSQKSRDIDAKLNDVLAAINGVNAQKGKKNRKGVAQSAGYKNVAELKRARADLMRQKALADRELGTAQTQGRRVIGVKPLAGGPADPTGSANGLFRQAFDLQNQTLVNALQGKEPVDATLRTAYDEKEKALRERLRRTLGPDYETSTAGQQAIANFDRERSEAFTQFNQQAIRDFSGLTENRASALSNLTGARMQQLLFPSSAQAASALALGQASSDRNAYIRQRQEGRGQQFEAKKAKYAADQQRDQARSDAIAGILGSVGQGLGSISTGGAGGIGSYLGAGTAASQTVNVPQYGPGPYASGYQL